MKKYIFIPVDILQDNINDLVEIALYIKGKTGLKKIKDKGEKLSSEWRNKLLQLKKNKQDKVLIETSDKAIFNLCNSAILKIIRSNVKPEKAIKEIYEILNTMYDALISNPVKESFLSISNANENIAKFIESNPTITKLTISSLKKDISTTVHTINVQMLVSGFSHFLGMRGTKFKIFVDGSFFHDIGKINIPDEILKKNGRLNDEEFEIMKKHTIYGYEILVKNNLKKYSRMALNHHEFIDGSGYPNGLKDDEISIFAKVLQICDIFEALTGIRPYKEPFRTFDALDLMKKNFVDNGKIKKELFEEFLNFLKMNIKN